MVKKHLQEKILEQELASNHHETLNKWEINLNHIVADSGVTALRALFLINGGGAVALLAFLASVHNQPTTSDQIVFNILDALWWFSIGVLSSALASGCTYITNFCYLNSIQNTHRI